jgi:hypothetical protein
MAKSLARFDPVRDFELWMWMSLTIGTHAVNAGLHKLGLTKPDNSYSYHVIGLYVVPPMRDGRWRKAAMPLGDIVHVDAPPVQGELSPAMQVAFDALQVLEDMRDPYIRRAEPITPALVKECEEAYRACLAQVATVLPELKEVCRAI